MTGRDTAGRIAAERAAAINAVHAGWTDRFGAGGWGWQDAALIAAVAAQAQVPGEWIRAWAAAGLLTGPGTARELRNGGPANRWGRDSAHGQAVELTRWLALGPPGETASWAGPWKAAGYSPETAARLRALPAGHPDRPELPALVLAAALLEGAGS